MISLSNRLATAVGIAALCTGCCGDSSDGAWLESGTGGSTDSGGPTTTTGESDIDSGAGGDSMETGWDTDTAAGTDPGDACGPEESNCCNQHWPGELSLRHVTLSVTVNGSVHEGSVYDDGDILLVNKTTGDRAYFGRVNQGKISAWVLEGKYDVIFESRPTASTLPENNSVTVFSNLTVENEEADADAEFDVDIDSSKVELTLMVNGEAPALSDYDDGVLSISETGYQNRTVVGKTSKMTDGKLTMLLVPGSYEVFYESEDQQIKMPYNRLAKIGEVEVAMPAEVQPETIDLEVVELSGDIFFDGKTPPQSDYDHGRIYLRDQLTGAVTEIADSAKGSITAIPVVGGDASYDVFYAADSVQMLAPANTWGRLNTIAIMGTDTTLSAHDLKTKLAKLEIQTVTVAGIITVDGNIKPADPDNRGNLLVGDGFGERAEIGDVAGGIQARLLRSDYDVFFRHEVSDGGLPANTFGIAKENGISATQMEPVEVDLTTSVVSGEIFVNGEAPPLSDYDKGEIFLRSGTGDRVFLAQTSSGFYSRRIMNGTYDVYYSVVNSQGGVPVNHETLIQAGLVVTGGELDYAVSINATSLSRTLPEFVAEATGEARFFVRKIGTKDELFVGKSGDEIDVLLLDGDYELIYRVENKGSWTPVNDGAVVGCTSPS